MTGTWGLNPQRRARYSTFYTKKYRSPIATEVRKSLLRGREISRDADVGALAAELHQRTDDGICTRGLLLSMEVSITAASATLLSCNVPVKQVDVRDISPEEVPNVDHIENKHEPTDTDLHFQAD